MILPKFFISELKFPILRLIFILFLSDIYNEFVIQFRETSELNKKNQRSLSELESRIINTESSHKNHTKSRKEYLDMIKAQLEDNLKLNKEVASRYRTLKFDFYNVKLDLMKKIELKLNTSSNLKDQRQLKLLQERMQSSLKDYLSYKSKTRVSNFNTLKKYIYKKGT